MPFVSVGFDDCLAEGAELVADLFEGLFESSVLDGRLLAVEETTDMLGGRHACGRGVAARDQCDDRRRAEFLDDGGVGGHVARAHDLKLRHRQAAAELVEIFAEQDLGEQLFNLAEAAFGVDALGPVGGFLQRFDIGEHPGEAVRGALFLVDLLAVNLAAGGDHGGHGFAEVEEITLGVLCGLANRRQKVRNHHAVRHSPALPSWKQFTS